MADAVVSETVTDTMVGMVSDASGKAAAAGAAGQALPEPYVPGSGEKLPAELGCSTPVVHDPTLHLMTLGPQMIFATAHQHRASAIVSGL